MPNRRQRDLRIARANARLRYGPETRGLRSLVNQAKSEFRTDQRIARGVADTAIRGARQAREPLARIYAESQSAADRAHDDVEAAFGRTGAGADPFKAITDREFALASQRRADTAAAERRDLLAQENQARLGRVFATGAARDRYNATIGQLRERARDLGGDRQAFIVAQLGELQGKRAELQSKERIARKGRESQERIAETYAAGKSGGGKGGKGGFEPASTSEKRMFRTQFTKALSFAEEYQAQGTARNAAQRTLTRGVSPNQKEGTRAVPAIDNQLALQAALDVAYRGRISRATRKQMLDAGVVPRKVPGIVTPRQYRRSTAKGPARAIEQAYASPRY